MFALPDKTTRGFARIRDSYANPRQSRGFAYRSPNPSSVYISLCKHRKKKLSIAFLKQFSREEKQSCLFKALTKRKKSLAVADVVHEDLYAKSGLVLQKKMLFKMRIFVA